MGSIDLPSAASATWPSASLAFSVADFFCPSSWAGEGGSVAMRSSPTFCAWVTATSMASSCVASAWVAAPGFPMKKLPCAFALPSGAVAVTS